ncbi:MAG: hypothetical protein V8R16_07780 [Bacilli bacterium]
MLFIFLVSCSNGVTETRKVEIKEDITLLENIDFDFKNTFFDDFSNGVDFSFHEYILIVLGEMAMVE